MSTIPFSQTGLHAVADPMVDIFQRVSIGVGRYTQMGGSFISLAAGSPDPSLLPTNIYQELVAEVLRTAGPTILNYGLPRGLPSLKEAFAARLDAQGVCVRPEDVLITSGGMEAISLAAWMLVNPGDTVIAEGPGYAGALSMFSVLGAQVIQVPSDDQGIRLDLLEPALKRWRPVLVSVMPDYQNPSGAVMPVEHRRKLAAMLRAHDTYALEDGAYALLRFRGPQLPPLQSFAPERVMYGTSVSKIIAPAMRVGALVAPAALSVRAADTKSAFNMQASAINEAVTAMFLNNYHGYFDSYLAKLRQTYKKRCDAMLKALNNYFPSAAGYSWTHPKGGMFLWLRGPEALDFTMLLDKAIDKGVAYVPGNKFCVVQDAAPRNVARLNFASTSEDQIEEGIRRLAEVVGQ